MQYMSPLTKTIQLALGHAIQFPASYRNSPLAQEGGPWFVRQTEGLGNACGTIGAPPAHMLSSCDVRRAPARTELMQ